MLLEVDGILHALSNTMQAHNVVGLTFSGYMFYFCVACNSEINQKTGCPAVFMVRGPHQPYMSDEVGTVGTLISAVPGSKE